MNNIKSSDGGSNPAKKRKGNEGNAIVSDGRSGGFLSSWFGYFSGRDSAPSIKFNDVNNNNNNSSSQLDRMEQIMMRMEEKCSSLETELRSVKDQVNRLEDNVHSLHVHAQQNHEYNQMLLRNQGWRYSAKVSTCDDWLALGYTNEAAYYLEDTAIQLKKLTIDMRRGIFQECTRSCEGISLNNVVGISLYPDEESSTYADSDDELRHHWDEFTEVLGQIAPAIKMVPDNFDCYFRMGNIVTTENTMTIIREALIGKQFTCMCFVHNTEVEYEIGGMNIDAIIRIAESNESLRKLEIYDNRIGSDHVERFCSIAHNHPLLELTLDCSMVDDGVGNAILTSLLSSQELNLEKLIMSRTNITSEVSTLLADFIANDPKMKELDLECCNLFNNNDSALIANALRSNITLRRLNLGVTLDAFKPVLCDTSSLNAIATSNHCCYVHHIYWDTYLINTSEKIEDNRGSKIYSLLYDRHVRENLSNTQYFSDIDVKLLPNMLAAIQKYGIIWVTVFSSQFAPDIPEKRTESVSIVYEVMRKWEKVFNLY